MLRSFLPSAGFKRGRRSNFVSHCKFTSSLLSIQNDNNKLPLSQVVKIHCTRSPADRAQQWQNKSQRHSTGSGFIISNQRILTNAHVVADQSFVTITKHNSGTHFPAKVTTVGHECDIAMLEVLDNSFFDSIADEEYFDFGDIPSLQDTVTVLGYPTGGDAISVTKGVVSRVEVVSYIHAAHYLLAIQIDAAINSGNSGGPAIMNNKVIGIAFQNMPLRFCLYIYTFVLYIMLKYGYSDAENVGYIIPTPIIEHFLGDIDRFGQYKGFCVMGIAYQFLLDTHSIHRFFGLPVDKTGILITKVFDYSVAKGVIKENDIVTHIDGHQIQNDGTTKFRQNETIAMEHLIACKYDQDSIDVTVWRDRQLIELKGIELSVPNGNKAQHLVPIHQYDQQSSYYIFGGCIFTVLTQPYLHTWGEEWFYHAPRDLITEAMKGELQSVHGEDGVEDEGHGIKELIVMASVRPHVVNMGVNKFTNIILEKVGNEKIKSLKHLKKVIESEFILKHDENELIDFHFRKGALMVLDVKESLFAESEIMERNRIPYRQSVDLNEFDCENVQNVFDQIREETMQRNQYYDDIDEENEDDECGHDRNGEDHSRLLFDCIKEQNAVQNEKIQN